MQQFNKNVVDSKVFRYKTEFSQAHEMEFLCYERHSQNQKFISQLKLTSTYIEKAWVEPSKRFRDCFVLICN